MDSLYALVDTAKITSLTQLFSGWQESIPALLRAASQLDEDTKEFLFQTVKALIALGVKYYPEMRSLREGRGEGGERGVVREPEGRGRAAAPPGSRLAISGCASRRARQLGSALLLGELEARLTLVS